MRFDWCKTNLHPTCYDYAQDHCDGCNITEAYLHGYKTGQEDMPKTGEWIRCKEQDKADLDNGNALYECSNCGHTDLHAETQEVPYCWFCGAKMSENER